MSRKYAGFTAEQRRELWRRWKDGETTSEIARALTKPPGSIHTVLAANGGIVPAERRRRANALTSEEREEISRGLAAGDSYRKIARGLGREPSTVSREVGRCGGRNKYRAANAERLAWKRAERPKPCLLATNPRLRDVVAAKLAEQWSPEQISGWLVIEFPGDDTMRVSHETIYRTLFIQARGALKKELVAHLRRVRSMQLNIDCHIVPPSELEPRHEIQPDTACASSHVSPTRIDSLDGLILSRVGPAHEAR